MSNVCSNIIFIAFAIGFVCVSCKKKSCEDPIPKIDFQSFVQKSNTEAQLTIGFIDCDGDIGLAQDERTAPYDYNLFLEYFEKREGLWTKITPLFPYYYRIPLLEGKTPYDLKEGDIIVDLTNYYDPSSKYDTIKYQIMLKDRALNESNTIETNEIITN